MYKCNPRNMKNEEYTEGERGLDGYLPRGSAPYSQGVICIFTRVMQYMRDIKE